MIFFKNENNKNKNKNKNRIKECDREQEKSKYKSKNKDQYKNKKLQRWAIGDGLSESSSEFEDECNRGKIEGAVQQIRRRNKILWLITERPLAGRERHQVWCRIWRRGDFPTSLKIKEHGYRGETILTDYNKIFYVNGGCGFYQQLEIHHGESEQQQQRQLWG